MFRKKRKMEEEQPGSPAWMTTYGDMMTLLLVFFVLLYSFSNMDLDKFQGFISSFQARMGVLTGGRTISEESAIDKGSVGRDFNTARHNLAKVMGEMSQYIEERDLENQVRLEMTQRGLVVGFSGEILYELGKAEIRPEGRRLLDKVAASLKEINNDVMVEGHTDNLPINNKNFPSNWELSTTRAINVIKYFIETHRMDPARLSAAGYSEYRPLYNNDTKEHRARNRRVEIVILNSLHNNTTYEGR